MARGAYSNCKSSVGWYTYREELWSIRNLFHRHLILDCSIILVYVYVHQVHFAIAVCRYFRNNVFNVLWHRFLWNLNTNIYILPKCSIPRFRVSLDEHIIFLHKQKIRNILMITWQSFTLYHKSFSIPLLRYIYIGEVSQWKGLWLCAAIMPALLTLATLHK